MILDFSTGIIKTLYNGEKLSSKKSYQGILKKISLLIIYACGFIIEYILEINNVSCSINVSTFVSVGICVNELISIIENTSNINGDTDISKMLLSILKNFKK